MTNLKWRKFPCVFTQLEPTLTGGQSFRWKNYKSDDLKENVEWLGVMGNCVWILKQNETHLFYKIIGELPYPLIENEDVYKDEEPIIKKVKFDSTISLVRMKVPPPKKRKCKQDNLLYEDQYYESLLKSYLRLGVNLEEHYKKWSDAHEHFRNKSGQFYAVRMLDQDPVENLFSFICSQNNHISRISTMVEKLCFNYGPKICDFEDVSYHAFPNVTILSDPKIENELRKASFGYRAKFIQKSAEQIIQKGGLKWFHDLQQLDYKSAHKELLCLTGIGPKVADCICLMSLNHLQAIPVDTHVYQIAVQNYLPQLKLLKSVTPKIYSDIGDKFRQIYGLHAGWAQTVLFCADLNKFKEKKSDSIQSMKENNNKKNVKLN